MENNLSSSRLRFTTDVAESVRASDIIFIAVGTPPDEDGSADLQHVLAVAKSIGQAMQGEKIVFTKSTVPVGTAAKVREAIEKRNRPSGACLLEPRIPEGRGSRRATS